MTRVGDPERERAAARLREHFVQGRLSVAELDERTALALRARTTVDLRRALRGLPEPFGAGLVEGLARGAALVVLTGAWLAFSFGLLVVLGLTMLIEGASAIALVAFLLVWLVPTVLLSRLWRRTLPRRTSSA